MAGSVMGAYASAFAAANAANEARYNQILSGYGERERYFGAAVRNVRSGYDDILKRQERVGDSQRIDLQDQYARTLASTKASMFNRGLGASTLYDSAQRGVNADLARSKIALEDSLAREYADVANKRLGFLERANVFGRAAIVKDKLDFMERKQELGPQAALFAQLAEMEGRGDAGGFGGGMMGGGGAFGSPGRLGAALGAAGISNPIPMYNTNPGSLAFGMRNQNYDTGQFATNNALASALGGMMGGAGGGGAYNAVLASGLGALGGAGMGARNIVNNMPSFSGSFNEGSPSAYGGYGGVLGGTYGGSWGGGYSGTPDWIGTAGGVAGGIGGAMGAAIPLSSAYPQFPGWSGAQYMWGNNQALDAAVGFAGYYSTPEAQMP